MCLHISLSCSPVSSTMTMLQQRWFSGGSTTTWGLFCGLFEDETAMS